MKRAIRLAAAAALLGIGASASAQTALRAEACVTPPAAEALFLTVAPDALRRVGQLCAASLPPSALLRRQPGNLIGRYAAESEAAWPRARAALGSIAGDASEMLNSDLARPLLTTLVGELLAKEVNPADCPVIDRILTLVEPLPPRNAAALVVTIVQLAQKPGRKSPLTICSGRTGQ
jgi:hypothetical protein